jgi:PAS domain S-box-containing protein
MTNNAIQLIPANYQTHLEALIKERTEDLSRKNKQLQQKMVERNNLQVKLFHAMDIARLGPWEYDFIEDRFTFNDHFYKLFNTTAEEVGGFTMSAAEYAERFVHPDDVPSIKKKIRELHASDLDYRHPIEHRIRYADGKTGHIAVRRLPVKDAGGRTVKIYGVNQDITEHKLAEAERERLMSAVEQVGEMVAIIDIEGRIEYVNPAFERATGYCRKEIINRRPDFIENGNTGDDFLTESWSTISKGDTWSGKLLHKRADGTRFTASATISPVRNASGKIVNHIAVSRDITEHLRLEDQLRQAQKMESVGRLAGGVAHDYNNMLGVIIGHAELALQGEAAGSSTRRHLEAILNAAQRSSAITRQLLAFARKQTIQPKIIDLNKTVVPMLEMLQRLIGEQISLKWIPKTDLWPVKMDPSQIDQILANLCVNAKDAIGELGNITIETDMVTIDDAYCPHHMGFVPGEYVMLAVSDDGCGMDGDTLGKVFEPFFTTKGVHKGTGLGLAMVYGIVKQNNGFINVYSEPGEGTTFRLYLPRQKGEVIEEAPKKIAAIPRGNGETVLLVEDEEIIIEMVERILEKLDYRVLTAETPLKALELAGMYAGEIDLLITDVIMPGMNGRDLAKEFKCTHPNARSLFMSGYTANVIVHQGVLDPGVHFLQKPFSIQDLAAKVREALELEELEGG